MKIKKIVSILAVFCIVLLGGICLTSCGGGGKNKLTIFFDSNGGTSVSTIEYVNGELTMPNGPAREDYLFGGWFEDNGSWNTEFDPSKASEYVSKKNITLYAKWLKKVILVFVVNTEQIEDVYLDKLDITLPTPKNPYSDENYTFAGWYLDNNLEKLYTTRTVVKPNDYNEVFLYPKWESNRSRSIYYVAEGLNLLKTSDIVEPQKRVTLYQPNIQFYEFCGWFYDRQFTKQAPLRVSYEMINSTGLILYGKFVQKEIYNISVVGQIKTHYEYGESIDLGNAKIFITYKDPKYESEIIAITSDMIIGFSTVDTGQYAYISLDDSAQPYDFCGSVSFKIDLSKFQNNGSNIPSTSINSNIFYTDNISYYVNSDLETFTLSEEELTFNFGDPTYLSSKNLSVNWTNKNGESGTEKLMDTTLTIPGGLNYKVSNLKTNSLGSSTFKLRYHFKTIEVNYTVTPTEIERGYIDETRNAILLNSQKSLIDADVEIYLHTPDGKDVLYGGLKLEDIIEDIDTSTSGEHKAKIKFNEQEIEISYIVIDLDKIESAEIKERIPQYFQSSYLKVTFTMKDGTTFDFEIDRNPIYALGGKLNAYFIDNIDISTAGTKYAKIYFYGKEIDVKYTVELSFHYGIASGIVGQI